MSFMEPDVQEADFFTVETNRGSEHVPADLVYLPFAVNFRAGGVFSEDATPAEWAHLTRALGPYVEGSEVTEIWPGHGFIARLSAPGYMDCTDWSTHASEAEALEYLAEIYGE